jgi:hypothetical protein
MWRILDCSVEESLCQDRTFFNSFFAICFSFSLHSHGSNFPSHSTPCTPHSSLLIFSSSPLTPVLSLLSSIPLPPHSSPLTPQPKPFPPPVDEIIVKVRAPVKLLRATADSEEYAMVLDEESSITQVSKGWCGVVWCGVVCCIVLFCLVSFHLLLI